MDITIGNLKCTHSERGCKGNFLPLSKIENHSEDGFFSTSLTSAAKLFDKWKCSICGHTISNQEYCKCWYCKDERMAKFEETMREKYPSMDYSQDWKSQIIGLVRNGQRLSAAEKCAELTGWTLEAARCAVKNLNH